LGGGKKACVKSAERAEKSKDGFGEKSRFRKRTYAPFKAPCILVLLCSVAGDNGELGGRDHPYVHIDITLS
jgi:hypothetical protein